MRGIVKENGEPPRNRTENPQIKSSLPQVKTLNRLNDFSRQLCRTLQIAATRRNPDATSERAVGSPIEPADGEGIDQIVQCGFKSWARNRQNLPSGGWPHDYYPGVLPQLPVKRGVFRSLSFANIAYGQK
jgi:hypothetical protein